ncbi:MAG: hypothetical protein HQK54_17070, partial [Oligoflexales bacterium]|nr:hypothetical protein [Oligoflexales bacterium]
PNKGFGWISPSGVKLGYGVISVKSGDSEETVEESGDSEEIDRKGNIKTATITAEGRFFRFMAGLGLGIQRSEIKGEDEEKGLQQHYYLTSPIFEINLHFRLIGGLFAGAVYRVQAGKGANYSRADQNKNVVMTSVAPSLIYRSIFGGRIALFIEAAQFRNTNKTERTVLINSIALGARYTPNGT